VWMVGRKSGNGRWRIGVLLITNANIDGHVVLAVLVVSAQSRVNGVVLFGVRVSLPGRAGQPPSRSLHLKTHAPAQCCHRKKTRTTVGAINHPITTQFRRRSNTASRQIGDHPRYGPPAKEPMPIGSVRCPFASSFLFLLRLSNTYPPRNILGTVFPPHLQLIPSHHHHCRISHSSSPIINHHQSLIINPHSHHQSPIINPD